MKLTIGMIVKNEEKWLDKCLTAIKPILDNVDSELIITDTGSTDRTVEIAQKYTDKVLHFDWIKDFSAARNYGLEKAQGEWFMMLDADDIFRSCDNIIDFFNSGEYKKYNAATYISRNLFKGENGDSFGDLLAPRMVKLHSNTRYENAVHESLNTFDPPYKNLKDIADHYGYYYESEEEKKKKFERNTEILLKRFETEKEESPMLYVQLYEAFMGIKDYEKALSYIESGIELCKKKNSIVLASLYFHKASYYQTDKEFIKAVEVCDEYFKMDKTIRPYSLTTDGEIYAIKAVSLSELEKYSEAIDSFKKFFDVYRDIESGKISTYDRYLISSYMCCEINILPLFNLFIDCCIKAEKFNTADSYLGTYPLYKYSFEQAQITELVHKEMVVAERFSFKSIGTYYKNLDTVGKKTLLDEIYNLSDKCENRQALFAQLDVIARNDKRVFSKTEIYKLYYSGDDFFSQIKDYIDIYGISDDVDLLCIMMIKHYDISCVLALPDLDLKKIVYLSCKNVSGFYEAAESYLPDYISEETVLPDAVKLYDYCISMRLMENEAKTKKEKELLISKLFEIKTVLNNRCRQVYTKNDKTSEFEKLAVSVKNNIKRLISSGNVEGASKTLDEYKLINPTDKEIPQLISLIKEKESE